MGTAPHEYSSPLTEDAGRRIADQSSPMNSSGRKVGVVLADNHPIFLQGLSALLGQMPSFKVIQIELDGASALRTIRRLEPAIAVLGVSMPGLAGIEVLKQVRKEGLATRIVILTAAASDVELVAAVRNGAWGILPKELAADAVRDCLTKVAGGESWLPPELIDPAMSREAEWQKESEKIESLLTQRELEISVLVSEGLSNKHIARHAGISEGTVKIHLYNAYKKLGGLRRASLTNLLTRYHHSARVGATSRPLKH
jgi:two-component system nitrate/nitrite response regulator NarL